MADETHTLLVVDDNEENRDMLSRRLKRRGYRVLSAESGEEALKLLDTVSLDLILLDIMMPGMDGIEVLRRVRSRFAQDELPIIMATAKDGSHDMVEALDLGANDYVTKPIDFAVVTARVMKELRGLDRARATKTAAAGSPGTDSGPLGPGSVIDNKYRLEQVVGRGNFGTVYQAHHIELDMPVAVKFLSTQAAEGEEALARFRSEGRATVKVKHPNAVTVYDFGTTEAGTAYLAMELLSGEPLSKELSRTRLLWPRRALEIIQPVCLVLAEAHAMGLVHRDIKPENIFLQDTPKGEVIKVVDFGIAKLAGDRINQQNLTADGYVLGTPAYVAPERLQNQPYGGPSDIYSLGVMAFQMLSGELPFKPNKDDPVALLMMHVNDTPPKLRSIVPELPKSIENLVMACLEKKPGKRPTAAQLAERIENLLEELPELSPAAVAAATGHEHRADDLEGPTHRLETPLTGQGIFHRLLDRFRNSGN